MDGTQWHKWRNILLMVGNQWHKMTRNTWATDTVDD